LDSSAYPSNRHSIKTPKTIGEIIEQDFVEYFRGLSQEKQLSLLEKLSSISEYSLLREETD